MACGNNKVSRAGLQTQPTQSVQLATPPMDQVARQRVEQAARTADQQIAQAKSAIDAAKSPAAVRDALSSAQKALDAARRAGGDTQAKARLRSLERQVEEICKVAVSKADDEAALTQMRHAAMRDSLGRQSLGVPRRATTRAPVPPREPVRDAANERAADPVSKAPGVPVPESQIVEAENAALQAESRSLDEIVADKKSAQRALSAALRTGAPLEQVDRLKAAIKKLQQTESRKRTPPAPPTVLDDVLAARAVPVDTAALLAKAMDNPLIPADLRAELPGAMQKVQEVSSHAPGLQIEHIGDHEFGRSSLHGGSVWASTVAGGGQVHGYAYEIIAVSRFIDQSKPPGGGGKPVHINKGYDNLIFGQKLPAGPDRRTIEADILIVKEGGHKVAIDAKNYGRSFGTSNELKEQLKGVKEAIRQGEVHEFHFAVRGAITSTAKEIIAQADTELRAEMQAARANPGATISDLQALSVDLTQPVICWHEDLG